MISYGITTAGAAAARNLEEVRALRVMTDANVGGNVYIEGGTLYAPQMVALGATANVIWNATSGELTRVVSSMRYKRNIDPYGASEWIYRIAPVTYMDKRSEKMHVGFIAEDIAEQEPLAAVLDDRGRVDNFEDRAVLAAVVVELKKLKDRFDAVFGN